MIINKYKLNYSIPILLVIGVIIFNILLYYSHQLKLSWIFDSDVSYIPALYQDIVLNNGSLSKWHLTPAPYIFPDIILYSIIIYIFEDYYVSASVFFTVQSLLIIHAVYLINRFCVSRLTSLIFVSIVFSYIVLFPSIVSDLLYVSAFHMGEFVISLYSIYLVLKIINSEKNHINFILLGVISSLILLSDKLYFIHFVLPCIGSIVFLVIIRTVAFKTLLKITVALIISIIAGYLSYEILIAFPHQPKVEFQFNNYQNKLNLLYSLFNQSILENTSNTIILILMYLASIATIVFRKKIEHYENFNTILFLSVFTLLVLISTIIYSLIFLNDAKTNIITSRYMIPVFLLPLLIGILFLHVLKRASKINFNQTSSIICVLLLFTLSFKAYDKLNNVTYYNSYYPDSVKCFDNFIEETNAKNGAAGYWISKSYSVLSRYRNITFAQYIINLAEYKWIISESWYRQNYDFFVINHIGPKVHRLDKNIIENNYGKASKVYKCMNSEILYYDIGQK